MERLNTPNPSIYTRIAIRSVLVCALTLGMYGCSFVERNTIGLFSDEVKDTKKPRFHTKKSTDDLKHIDVEKLDTAEPTKTGVEVIWKIPEESVDGFVIYYGLSKDKLDDSVRLDQQELQTFEDDVHGAVYHHVLQNVPQDKTVFVSIAAFRDDVESERTEIFEVAGAEATAN